MPYHSHEIQIQTTVKGGFPVTATATWCPAEPDVGLMDSYLEDVSVSTLRGKSCNWLKLTGDDLHEVEQAIWNSMESTRKGR